MVRCACVHLAHDTCVLSRCGVAHAGAEFVGEILVEMLGLNRSRYQDIYEMHMAEQERLRAHRLRELEQLRKLRDAEAKALARAAASSSGEHDESEV